MIIHVNTANVSANIRAEVARAGRTQADVAAAAGIKRGRWYSRMRYPNDWTLGELHAIADELGIPTSRLTGEGVCR